MIIKKSLVNRKNIKTSMASLRGNNFLLVKTKMIGVCKSDCDNFLDFSSKYFGHEIICELCTENDIFNKNKRYILRHKVWCYECNHCKDNATHLCENFRDVDLGFSNYYEIPNSIVKGALYELPDSISNLDAVFLDSISSVVHAIKKIDNSKVSKILILGSGFMALLFQMILENKGFKSDIMCRNVNSDILIDKFIKGDSKLYHNWDDIENIYDCTIDTTGSTDYIVNSLNRLMACGILLCFSRFKSTNFSFIEYIRNKEVRLLFSRYHNNFDLSDAIKLVEQGVVRTSKMINMIGKLGDLEKIIEYTNEKRILRGVIEFE